MRCQIICQIGSGNLFVFTFTFLVCFSLAFVTCVEPFEPEVGAYDQTLVVDGLFSDSEEPIQIRLSQSFGLNEADGVPVEDAMMKIEDELGNFHFLNENEPGSYWTDPDLFKGIPGRSYRISITTRDGNAFASEFEQLKAPPDISGIYYELVERELRDPSLHPIRGLQFYLDTDDTEGLSTFFRWEFEETYQYGLEFPARIKAEFGSGPGNNDDEIIPIPFDEFEGLSCYKTLPSRRIIIGSTERLVTDRIERQPIQFVDDSTPKLYIKYSILIKQYAISKEHHDFLAKLVEVNQSTGSLFDPIPNEVLGNVKSIDGKNIPVLGYFGVGGVTTSRIFVTRDDLPNGFSAPIGPSCMNDTLPLNNNRLQELLDPGNLVLYDYHRNLFGFIIGYLLTEPPCSQCAANDATNQIPDFW